MGWFGTFLFVDGLARRMGGGLYLGCFPCFFGLVASLAIIKENRAEEEVSAESRKAPFPPF